MLHALYLLFIAPLEFFMRLALEWGFSWTHSWGWSLVLLSLAVNTALLPISRWAERLQEAERELRRSMVRHEAMLRECFRGQEHFALTSALRRLSGYGRLQALRAGVGLLVQIPFFIAAYHLLSDFSPFQGRPFGLLPDLGAPDGLLSLGAVQINMLPFVMTAVNLVAAFVYAQDLSRRDKGQTYAVSLLFLVLLYPVNSALVLYWTLNNVYALCRNVVEKNWMRRPVWRQCRGRALEWSAALLRKEESSGRLAEMLARGKRFVQAGRYGFGATACFCAVICLCRLSAYEYQVPGQEKDSLLFFLYQCGVTGLFSTGALLGLGAYRLKRKTEKIALFLYVFLLPACQIDGFSVKEICAKNYFYFNMWEVRGLYVFLIWVFFLQFMRLRWFGISRRIRRFVNNIVQASSLDVQDSITASFKARGWWSCLLGTVAALFLCEFMPLYTYLYNVNEFSFNSLELISSFFPYLCIFALTISVLLFATTYIFHCECVQLPSVGRPKAGGHVNIIHVLVVLVLSCLLVEGTILSYGLPELDGNERLFESRWRTFVDSAVWLAILFIGIRYWRYFAKRMHILLCLLVLFTTTALLDAYRTSDKKLDFSKFQGENDLYFVDGPAFFSRLCFSKKDNIIILLFDSIDTFAFEKTLETFPELKKVFQGFWLFRQNLGSGGMTLESIPQIQSGLTYNPETDFYDFVRNSEIGNQSMAALALRSGRKVFVDGYRTHIVDKSSIGSAVDENSKKNTLARDYLLTLSFRFFPYFCNRIYEERVNIKNYDVTSQLIAGVGNDFNKIKFNDIIPRINVLDEKPVFQFLYFFGAHLPFIKKEMIATTKEIILDLDKFMKIMRRTGLFDKTTFIIMADHGLVNEEHDHRHYYPERKATYSTYFFPFLMIKTPDASGEMVIREDLMSSVYVKRLLVDFFNSGATGQVLEKSLSALPPTRRFFIRGGLLSQFPKSAVYEARGTISNLEMKQVDP